MAPFDGVVTARNTDVGALINVGGAPGTELFVVSDTRKLRVYVSVPQNLVSMLRPGSRAQLTVPERAGKQYAAEVSSMSNAINTASGSMLVQLSVDNSAGELLPGSFANVSFAIARAAGTLSIPPSAMIFDKSGLRVATVGPGDKVVLKPGDGAARPGHDDRDRLGAVADRQGHREPAGWRGERRLGRCGEGEALGASRHAVL